MSEFTKLAKEKYEELLKQKEEIDNELKPLSKYLEAIGELSKRKIGSRKKKEQWLKVNRILFPHGYINSLSLCGTAFLLMK